MQTREDDDENKIIFQGWGVFYAQDSSSKFFMGQKFFSNQEFFEQKKSTDDVVGDADKFGPKNIPSGTSFWMLINKKGLYFLASRKDAIQKFKHFTPFNALKDGKEAFKELGQFDEGYCLQINAVNETLIVCLPTQGAFASFFMAMEKWASKSASQSKDSLNFEAAMTEHETEQIVDYPHLDPNGWDANSKFGQGNVNRRDSYWMLMKSWGECSVSCGGGTKTRQLVCVKGTEGKPCVGKSVQTRPCNLQPCTPLTPHDTDVTIKPMIIKTQGASKRPCQYQPCYLKECDLILIRDDMKGFQVPPRLPARVVMNNATLSIFMSDNFGDVMWSADLNDIRIADYPKDVKNCFVIKNDRLGTTRSVCGMPLAHDSLEDQVIDWREKIEMFKNKCPRQFKTEMMFPPEEDPTVMAKKADVAATAKALANEAKITENDDASKKVNVEFDALKDGIVSTLNKEIKFQNLVEQEELMRQRKKKEEVKKKKEELKTQEECLEHKKQLETEEQKQDVMEESAKQTIADVKNAVKDMIIQSRNKQNQKLNLLRKIKNKSRSSDEVELTEIREKIAKELKKAFEKGDPSKCKPEAPQADIMSVCNKYYINEPIFYDKCQVPEAFCTYCCVGCFGNMFPKEKNACLDGCLKQEQALTTSQVWDKTTAKEAGLA